MLILWSVEITFPNYARGKEIFYVSRNTDMMKVFQPVVAKTWVEFIVKQNIWWLDVLVDEGWRTNFMEVPDVKMYLLR
jgi:hypothetical protein